MNLVQSENYFMANGHEYSTDSPTLIHYSITYQWTYLKYQFKVKNNTDSYVISFLTEAYISIINSYAFNCHLIGSNKAHTANRNVAHIRVH